MNNTLLKLKIEQRLNKISSQDYSNIKPWMVIEAFNKAQIEWIRRNLHGNNLFKEGDEQSVRRIDDLQILLTSAFIPTTNNNFYVIAPMPSNYLAFKRLDVEAKKDCCKDVRNMRSNLIEEAMVNQYLNNENSKPSFEWGETFFTMIGNNLHIYHNKDFDVNKVNLVYYRFPRKIEIAGVENPENGQISPINVESELKDDLLELIVDDAAAILAADIESFNQYQRETQNAERNN
jgi:hypothetical protein